jgi:hypothetical protein
MSEGPQHTRRPTAGHEGTHFAFRLYEYDVWYDPSDDMWCFVKLDEICWSKVDKTGRLDWVVLPFDQECEVLLRIKEYRNDHADKP